MRIDRTPDILDSYQALPLAEVLLKEGLDPEITELEVCAPGAILTLRPGANEYTASTTPVAPAPATPEIAAIRTTVCTNCTSLVNSKCSVAGCDCAGIGQPGIMSSRCPRGLWPANPRIALPTGAPLPSPGTPANL